MNMTNYLEQKLAKHCLGIEAYTMPTAIYMGLSTVVLDDDTTSVEPTAADYARLLIDNTLWDVIDGEVKNNDLLKFPPAENDWGEIKAIVLYDESGNALIYANLGIPVDIVETVTFGFFTGDFAIQFK
jgi:hypothetical protein